jgi:hypothetical protein
VVTLGTAPARTGLRLVDAYLDRPGSPVPATDSADLAAFCGWLAARCPDPGRGLDGLCVEDVLAFASHELRPRGRGRRLEVATVYRRLAALGRFCAWATAAGALRHNPVPPERAVAGPWRR